MSVFIQIELINYTPLVFVRFEKKAQSETIVYKLLFFICFLFRFIAWVWFSNKLYLREYK